MKFKECKVQIEGEDNEHFFRCTDEMSNIGDLIKYLIDNIIISKKGTEEKIRILIKY